MSLEQLERQIQLASFALEKANKSGDKLKKAKVREELAKFTQVLERSKARLLELEAIQKQCDQLSETREIKESKSTLPKQERVKPNRIQSLVKIFSGSEMKSTLPHKKSFADELPVEVTAVQKWDNTMEITIVPSKENVMEEKPELQPEEQLEERQEEPKEQPQETKCDVAQAEERDDVQAELDVAEVEKFDEAQVEKQNNDVETSSVADLAMSFGNQIVTSASGFASDISSLGSQIWGTSEITKAINKEIQVQEMHRSRSADYMPTSMLEPLHRFSTAGSFKSKESATSKPKEQEQTPQEQKFDEKEIEQHLEMLRSYATGSFKADKTLTPEYIAEQELKAREKYIRLTKEHQQLRRTGIPEDSPLMKKSEKMLRDSYAEIEYWESLGEEASSVGSQQKIKNFLARNPTKSSLDVDEETAQARDAYTEAMMHHQSLVANRVCTSSKEWMESQAKLDETLVNLRYWEGRAAFAVPPSI